jgi:hypothetical protein
MFFLLIANTYANLVPVVTTAWMRQPIAGLADTETL